MTTPSVEACAERQAFVFFGDSVTAAHRDPLDPLDLGDGFVRVVADTLAKDAGLRKRYVVNLGIGGNRVRDLRARWSEVVSVVPDVLSVLVGINDVWRHFSQDEFTPPSEFREDLRFIVEKALGLNSAVILLEPFLLPLSIEQTEWLPELHEKAQIVRELGAEYDAPVIPLQEVIGIAATNTAPSDLAADGIHPSERGHRIIANAWLRGFLEQSEGSSLRSVLDA